MTKRSRIQKVKKENKGYNVFLSKKAKCGHTLRTIGWTYWFIEKAVRFKPRIVDLDLVQSGSMPFN